MQSRIKLIMDPEDRVKIIVYLTNCGFETRGLWTNTEQHLRAKLRKLKVTGMTAAKYDKLADSEKTEYWANVSHVIDLLTR